MFTDLDDTLTDEAARVSGPTYEALWRLREAGLFVALVTGRPAGWADSLMRLWPLDAVVFENGAAFMVRSTRGIETHALAKDLDLPAQKTTLEKIFQKLKREFPSIKLAKDQPFRVFDYAIDFAEDPPFLPPKTVKALMAKLEAESKITAKLSSIHINYWCGKHTKATACRSLVSLFKKSRRISLENSVYVGDSPNDEPLFEIFTNSVGVANIKAFWASLQHPPRYTTKAPRGEGFCEIVDHLLS